MRSAPRRPIVRALSPFRDFLRTESAGGVLVVAGALAALVWANSPWSEAYHRLWESRLGVTIAGHTLELDLRHWLGEGLMAIFFLVVGLEIKRELTQGHLASRRAAMLPVAAAIGGMVVPALLYLAIAGGSEPRGWAIPMATDIALAVGVVALAGDRIDPSMRVFLLALAIVDDIGAIAVIAAFYSSDLQPQWLVAAAAALCVTLAMKRIGVNEAGWYWLLGACLWFCLHEAGVHATLAGVAMGLLAPSTPRVEPRFVDVDELNDLSSPENVRATVDIARSSVSVVEWLQHVLHPWTGYVIVPLFALANAGVEVSRSGLGDAMRSPVTWGIIVGLVVGKPLGIILASSLARRAGVADQPDAPASSRVGIATSAGIGFTVALFIVSLAFPDPAVQSDAKLGVLIASAVAAGLATVLLRVRTSE